MKKLLCTLLCLSMLLGCSAPKEPEVTIEQKLKETEIVNLDDDIKDFEVIEQILIDHGYKYEFKGNSISLLAPDMQYNRVIIYSPIDSSSSMILMLVQTSKTFTFFKNPIGTPSFIMGDNGNAKWDLENDVPLENSVLTDQDMEDMLKIKEGYNAWSQELGLSVYDLYYFFELYYHALSINYTDMIKMDVYQH